MHKPLRIASVCMEGVYDWECRRIPHIAAPNVITFCTEYSNRFSLSK